jgi:signal transduction histidine kinase
MTKRRLNLFRRIGILIFILITVLSLLFIEITYLTTTEFYQSSTQLVDKDVAAHIAKFTSPFEDKGLNKNIADSVFYNAMVLNPSIEVYFLDTTGKIMYYHAPDSAIKLREIPLTNIRKHIQANGEDYIKGPDPKNPSEQKVFSAAEVNSNGKKLGYIYVIVGGNEYKHATGMLFKSHLIRFAVIAFCLIIIISVILSLLYINRLQKNFKKIILVLNAYMKGNFDVRFDKNEKDEFAPITESFNKMATLLSYNINRLKQTEQERKDFIATISHDLRTPLSVAKGYTETAITKIHLGEINRHEIDGFIQLVHKKLQQIEIMVQDLFELSRMESIHFAPNKELFIFSEVLNEIYNTSERNAAVKNIIMTCKGCEDLSWIHADIRMMERVVQNLFDNAIKYTHAEGSIHIAVERKDDLLNVIFSNSGILSNDLMNWINVSARHADASVITKPANSGLGLLIVKKILELHDYAFEVKTVNGFISFRIQMKTANPVYLTEVRMN